MRKGGCRVAGPDSQHSDLNSRLPASLLGVPGSLTGNFPPAGLPESFFFLFFAQAGAVGWLRLSAASLPQPSQEFFLFFVFFALGEGVGTHPACCNQAPYEKRHPPCPTSLYSWGLLRESYTVSFLFERLKC